MASLEGPYKIDYVASVLLLLGMVFLLILFTYFKDLPSL